MLLYPENDAPFDLRRWVKVEGGSCGHDFGVLRRQESDRVGRADDTDDAGRTSSHIRALAGLVAV